ncbi:MAG: hypothetical protein ABI863_20140 [Ginsengibacter sp.]
MPNRFHSIIMMGKNQYNDPRRDAMHGVSTTHDASATIPDAMHGVSTTHDVSTTIPDAMHGVSTTHDASATIPDAMHGVSTTHGVSAKRRQFDIRISSTINYLIT